MRVLHAGNDRSGTCVTRGEPQSERNRGARSDWRQSVPLHRLPADRRGGAACGAAPEGDPVSAGVGAGFRFIGKKRRTKEDPRFVAGRGRFVADIALPQLKHVALVTSPYACARIVRVDAAKALAVRGCVYVLSGEELCAAVDPL